MTAAQSESTRIALCKILQFTDKTRELSSRILWKSIKILSAPAEEVSALIIVDFRVASSASYVAFQVNSLLSSFPLLSKHFLVFESTATTSRSWRSVNNPKTGDYHHRGCGCADYSGRHIKPSKHSWGGYCSHKLNEKYFYAHFHCCKSGSGGCGDGMPREHYKNAWRIPRLRFQTS